MRCIKPTMRFSLINEIKDTIHLINNFSPDIFLFKKIEKYPRFLFTGEGSSRIFPAKNAISRALSFGLNKYFFSWGCYDAISMNLDNTLVFGASNSGRTRELIFLFKELKRRKIPTVGLTIDPVSPLIKFSDFSYILSCGFEKAVAATKSVVNEALFFDSFIYHLSKNDFNSFLKTLYKTAGVILKKKIEKNIIETASIAKTIYFIGPDNGVGEELALKAIEITRKQAFFFEGTRVFHGIEEILKPKDLIILIRPFKNEEKNYLRLLNTGVKIIAINDKKIGFPTILIPPNHDIKSYVELFIGWKLLVEVGLKLGINIDKPRRVKKVGNPF